MVDSLFYLGFSLSFSHQDHKYMCGLETNRDVINLTLFFTDLTKMMQYLMILGL